MLRRRRAHKLIDRAQPFAAEPLLAVANFTWVRPRRADLAGGLPDWTLIGAGAARLWIIEGHHLHPDTGASLIGSWPLVDIRMTEESYPRAAGPFPLGSSRAIRFEFPDRDPVVLQPFGREVDALVHCHHDARSGVRWHELVEVALINSAEGTSDEDVIFAFTYEDGTTAIVGVGESGSLLRRLQELPGFDNETFNRAMGVSEEAASVLWRRSG